MISEAFSTPEGPLGLLVTVYSWSLAAAALIMGPISDKIGRRKVLLIGSGALTLALAAHGLAQSFAGLMTARLAAGACGGMLSGAAVAYIGDTFPYEKRGSATGIVMSGIAFGLVIGVPIGRVLAAGLGFRIPFLAFAALMAFASFLIWWIVPQPDVDRDDEPLRFSRALQGYGRLFRGRETAAATAAYFLMFLGLGLLVTHLPIWLTAHFNLAVDLFGQPLQVMGLPIDFIATLFLVGGTASVVVGPPAGKLSDSWGRRPLILSSCIGLTIITVALTAVATERWIVYLIYLAIMAMFALRMSPFQALITALVPDRQRGTFMSLCIAVGQIGTGLGAAASGQLYEAFGYSAATYASAAATVGLGFVVWRVLPEPKGDVVPPPAPATVAKTECELR